MWFLWQITLATVSLTVNKCYGKGNGNGNDNGKQIEKYYNHIALITSAATRQQSRDKKKTITTIYNMKATTVIIQYNPTGTNTLPTALTSNDSAVKQNKSLHYANPSNTCISPFHRSVSTCCRYSLSVYSLTHATSSPCLPPCLRTDAHKRRCA